MVLLYGFFFFAFSFVAFLIVTFGLFNGRHVLNVILYRNQKKKKIFTLSDEVCNLILDIYILN